MKKKQSLNQNKINIIFGSLIALLFVYSALATYIAVEAYNGVNSTTEDLATQIFNLWAKDDSSH
jgi:hypothetical protein